MTPREARLMIGTLCVVAGMVLLMLVVAPRALAATPSIEPGAYVDSGKTVRLHRAERPVKALRVKAVASALVGTDDPRMARLTVWFNDGSAYDMKPCRLEDSGRCWWNADMRGNESGTSFVRLHGHMFVLTF